MERAIKFCRLLLLQFCLSLTNISTPPINKDLYHMKKYLQLEYFVDSVSSQAIGFSYSEEGGNEPYWIIQIDLNDLTRDLYLSKQQSEL